GAGPDGALLPNYDPEYVRDVELGAKSDWSIAHVPIRTNAAVYYEKYTDIQSQITTFLDSAPVPIISNAAKARLWGAELEATIHPTENLQLGINFDYLNFEYTHFDSGVDPDAITQLEANRLAGRPPRKYGASVRYRLPLSPQVGTVSMQ